MNLILRRCAILALAVLAVACGDDCAYDSGLFGESTTPPPPALDGIWEGREAPFIWNDTYPWWRFDVEWGGSGGTFVTDREFYRGPRGDTIRGTFSASEHYCRRWDEIDWQFELRDGANPKHCTLEGRASSGGTRIDGLLGCTSYPGNSTRHWKALYLIHERERRQN